MEIQYTVAYIYNTCTSINPGFKRVEHIEVFQERNSDWTFGTKQQSGENYLMKNSAICTIYKNDDDKFEDLD